MKISRLIISFAAAAMLLIACNKGETDGDSAPAINNRFISDGAISKAKDALKAEKALETSVSGVEQVALFWTKDDGSEDEFVAFCTENAVKTPDELDRAFEKISGYMEVLRGHYNKISLDLKETLHLENGKNIETIDMMFGGYDPSANFSEDCFGNKIAFYVLLNFPFRNLEYKTANADKMSRKDWAMARVAEMFTSRVPGAVNAKISEVLTGADTYISDYNIYMGNIVDDKFATFFPSDMKLISHWNLRDELKSQYANPDGLKRQKLIYDIMQHIILQDIPQEVINKNDYQWNPATNKIYKSQKEVASNAEPCTRYEWMLNMFHALKAADPYCPFYNTYIKRKFEEEMELAQPEVEKLFVNFVSSPVIKRAAKFVEKRLGRKLMPFDIWYGGFKGGNELNEENLSKITRAKYPNVAAFKSGIPEILTKLGFTKAKAEEIAARIDVDGARGAGHAWGAEMKSENAHLRTRIGKTGMDYKGYNIAVHELGHCVEQTLSLQDIDYYMIHGVPSNAFTEAWAFVFQTRDKILLGAHSAGPEKEAYDALDNLWAAYEIMGVSLVDMNVWKWLYENPNATKEQLRDQTIKIAKEIWNKYYAENFGVKDQTILAIYSHMIDNPLYLSAYPIGHLIQFQMEQQFVGKNVGEEMQRICTQGRLAPQYWMQKAVGSKLSGEPTLKAAERALNQLAK